MRNVYQQELAEVQQRLVEIAELLLNSTDRAVRAFGAADVALAEEVIDNDDQIDRRSEELDALVIEIIARQQPVASDLRLLIGSLRMSASLERMADLVQHIAELARYRYPDIAIPSSLQPTFRSLGDLDVQIARNLVTLLRDLNGESIRTIRELDTRVDELHAEVFAKVLSKTVSQDLTGMVDAIVASRYHERFGDHAKKICWQVHYYVTGKTA